MTKTCSCQVNNLNEKIKVPELKNCLLELFSSYGEVIDIVAAGSLTKKGQAFVVFRDISCATNALRALNGFVFLDKPMKINYCRTKSDIVAHEDGTWKPRAKLEAQKEEAKRPKTTPALVPPKTVAPKMAAHPAGGDAADGQSSNVLFVENLPAEVNEVMLTMLFRQYPGFQEARLIKGRNVAFIEYADELQARRGGHTKVRNAEKLKTKYNLGPMNYVPVVRSVEGSGPYASPDREVCAMRWGLVPSFAKQEEDFNAFKGGSSTFNARIEGAETRNLWRRLLDTRRCIVLFDGFYEWKAHADGKTKIPMFIRNKDEYDGHVIPWVSDEANEDEKEKPDGHAPLLLAGLYDTWQDDAKEPKDLLESAWHPVKLLKQVHDRMPVFLTPRLGCHAQMDTSFRVECGVGGTAWPVCVVCFWQRLREVCIECGEK
ncbi:unnamed protein product [Durusdinium trenchii]|uniref:RRM domain-containing protein n=1 Tax=Durusdinium trenchii TaxID=1381693 RepID=A0ABP0IF88_9DINO